MIRLLRRLFTRRALAVLTYADIAREMRERQRRDERARIRARCDEMRISAGLPPAKWGDL
jgi:hypothetical protein